MTGITDKSRLLREIAAGVVVSMLIIFVTMYLPVLGFFMAVILPMPILYFRLKLGRKPGVAIMLSVSLMAWAATGGLSIDMLFYSALLLSGFFLGEFLEMRLSIEKSFLYTLFSTLGICSTLFFLHVSAGGGGILQTVSEYVAQNVRLTLSLYKSMGMSQENMELISSSVEAIQYVLVRIIPSLIVIMISFVIWINTLFIKKILVSRDIHLKALENLNLWKAPEHLVWVAILLGFSMFIPGRTIKIVSFNCIMILMPVYFFQGMAIVAFIFEKKKLPSLLRVFFYSIIGIQQILILAVVGLGFFDTWMDFRKTGMTNNPDGHSPDV